MPGLPDFGSDAFVRSAMPGIMKLIQPVITDARKTLRATILGPMPPSLPTQLAIVFSTTVSDEQANKIWQAVGLALQEYPIGEPHTIVQE